MESGAFHNIWSPSVVGRKHLELVKDALFPNFDGVGNYGNEQKAKGVLT